MRLSKLRTTTTLRLEPISHLDALKTLSVAKTHVLSFKVSAVCGPELECPALLQARNDTDIAQRPLLFHCVDRWKSQLSLRALWVPSLYVRSWRQDHLAH